MDIEDYSLDYYMEQLKEPEQLNEVDPITMGAAISLGAGTIYTVSMLIQFFIATAMYRKTVKVDQKLTQRLNGILDSGEKWIVHIFPDKAPNAFAIGGRHVYITTGLLKILNEREVDAVLLHEVYHNKDMHVWKNLAAESSFLYLTIFINVSIWWGSAGAFPLALITFFIIRNSMRILYARFRGRHFEIKSDEFAVKQGYGPELVSALKKIEAWAKKAMAGQKCNKFCQLERKISEEIDEHPPIKKRIETILRKTKELDQAMASGYKAISTLVMGVFKQNG